MNRKTDGRLTFTVLSISLLTVMAGAAIAPALGLIRDHFSTEPDMLVQLIISLPALLGVSVGMIMPLSTGLLAYYFPPDRQA